jgi:hypothetical protein
MVVVYVHHPEDHTLDFVNISILKILPSCVCVCVYVVCCVTCDLHFDYANVRFEVFTAVTMKNVVFWVVTPYGSCKNQRFGGTWRLLHQGDKNR